MGACGLLLLLGLAQFAQSNAGELRIRVTDGGGLPLPGPVEIISEANEVRRRLATTDAGDLVVRRLPFGTYEIHVSRSGFAAAARVVEVRSAVPAEILVAMSLAAVQAQVTVAGSATLIDPHQVTPVHRVGAGALQQRTAALPGRSLPDVVNTQPGWLLEANGILHPRGSEYQTQYVVDGLPMTDNRSPVFAPESGADAVQGLTVMTGGYPAEYGRKLGGVIEVVTATPTRRGFGGSASASFGSFQTTSADANLGYAGDAAAVTFTAATAATDRYLDPPVEEHYTNHGTASNAAVRIEGDLAASGRAGLILRHGAARFLVPNEYVQEQAGQRQDRDSQETAVQLSAQQIVSSTMVAEGRAMVRDLSAGLWSNPASTPIGASQDRGFRELYLRGTLSKHAGVHELKAGGDIGAGTVREAFAYAITDADQFAVGTPATFSFDDRRRNLEAALFVQDQIRAGAWTVQAGLRWDRYRLVVRDQAFSPRLAAAWSWPAADLVLRASYDRVFQTPAIENLLIASADDVDRLGADVVRLPVPASRGHFYEAGFSKAVAGRLRLDGAIFRRRMTDVADDDLLLNTGVSFPIAFERAEIDGAELTLDLRQWRKLSGALGYSHLRGVGQLPVTGGLFLGEEATAGLSSTGRFPVTQDQRHTVRGHASYRISERAWVAMAGSYGSGLPFEDFDGTPEEAAEQFGDRVVARVNFDTGRVRPSASLDVSAGVLLAESSRYTLRLQAEVRNLTNRLDVINFAGLFSGTALAAPRSAAVRVRVELR